MQRNEGNPNMSQELTPGSVRALPQCALCHRQAVKWIQDQSRKPYLEMALCLDHCDLRAFERARQLWELEQEKIK